MKSTKSKLSHQNTWKSLWKKPRRKSNLREIAIEKKWSITNKLRDNKSTHKDLQNRLAQKTKEINEMKKHLYELQSPNNMDTEQEQGTPKRTKFPQGAETADEGNTNPH